MDLNGQNKVSGAETGAGAANPSPLTPQGERGNIKMPIPPESAKERNAEPPMPSPAQRESLQADNKPQQEADALSQEDFNSLFGKPENYDYKDVPLPDGMTLNQELTAKFNEYAAKLNLSQKSADDFIKMASELAQITQDNAAKSFADEQRWKIESYKTLLNSDKEIGGEKLKDAVKTANNAYDRFFQDEELRELFAQSGLTVHPKFIKALKSIGALMQNDSIHFSDKAPGEKLSREDILFPTMG